MATGRSLLCLGLLFCGALGVSGFLGMGGDKGNMGSGACAAPGVNEADTITMNTGQPVWSYNESMTLGRRGPVLLEDMQLIEKMQQFDRERIPERVVHARGGVAKGYFEVTHDITDLTMADVFSKVGKRTPVAVRFSTVIHPRGSAETIRDPRGFATKFYTQEGNWDLVGNNIPVFFIRDGINFPDMIHALKPSPITNMQEAWRIVDYFSFKPEAMHMFTWVFDDHGIPQNYRVMDGFGVHTFVLANKEGKQTYVKFTWKNNQGGPKHMLEEEAFVVGGMNPSHATVDLYNAIAEGNYPSWELNIQTMDPQTENDYDFDPLDDTKEWPVDRFPLKPVGRMVLDTNIDNFHNEAEQSAFSPGNLVPGILPSNDKMLQSRLFSYQDTQRHRLGPNYQQLPINRPRCPFQQPTTQEGLMNVLPYHGREINYHPSHFSPQKPTTSVGPDTTMQSGPVEDKRTRATIEKTNDFGQAGARWRTFDEERQKRFVKRMAQLLGHPKVTKAIQAQWLYYFEQMDVNLAAMVTEALAKGDSMAIEVKASLTKGNPGNDKQ